MEIECSKCGAKLQYEPGTRTLQCEYCGNTIVLDAAEGTLESADYIKPFTLDEDSAVTAARAYMTTGLTTPDDLATAAKITEVKFLFLPAWDCSGQYKANWSASFGYDRKEVERYYNRGSKRWETRTRTVTDWTPHSGTTEGVFHYLCPASHAYPRHCASIVFHSRISGLISFDSRYCTGVELLPFQLTSTAAFEYAKPTLAQSVEQAVKNNRLGDQQKDWSWNTVLEFDTPHSVYAPVVQVTFEYKQQTYTTTIDGCDGSHCLGDLPSDKGKEEIEATAKKSLQWVMVPTYAAILLSGVQMFTRNDYSASEPIIWIGMAVAALYSAITYYKIKNEKKKYDETSAQIRRAALIRAESADAKIDMTNEEMAQLANQSQQTIKPYKPDIGIKKWLFVLVTIFSLFLCTYPWNFDSDNQETWADESYSAPSAPAQSYATEPQQTTPAATPATSESQAPVESGVHEITLEEAPGTLLNILNQKQYQASEARQLLDFIQSFPISEVGETQMAEQLNAHGIEAFNKKDYALAAKLFERATQANPIFIAAFCNLSAAQLHTNNMPAAEMSSMRALILAPYNRDIWELVRVTCYQNGHETCRRNAEMILQAMQPAQ